MHSNYCAIDFGTSNSAIAIPKVGGEPGQTQLVELEPGHLTMPTAVFYKTDGRDDADGPPRAYGRAAVAAYVEGADGRLMRSMKSILGSGLAEQSTDVGGGRAVKYADIVAGYLKQLKYRAQKALGQDIHRVVLGRPVFFVDADEPRDELAQRTLQAAAEAVGFKEVHFQYEPIAAAFDYERQTVREEIVLVADIGGGTSDFSLVRVGPQHRARLDRRSDILASHGVHIAGTDFDRHIELASILREFGYRALGPSIAGSTPREVPSAVYFDLATWHLINTVYTPARVAELRAMKSYYGEPKHHERLMTVLTECLGHELAARAEEAKINVSGGSDTVIDLTLIERDLQVPLSESTARKAIDADMRRIVMTARDTVQLAGLQMQDINALYFTGGSTGLRVLAERIAAEFPQAKAVRGDRFASVATGLGIHAAHLYG